MLSQGGNTPIHYACKEAHINIIRYFLTQKVDTTIKNNKDETPTDCVPHDNVNRADILKLFTDQVNNTLSYMLHLNRVFTFFFN